jgi:hypothetical protein
MASETSRGELLMLFKYWTMAEPRRTSGAGGAVRAPRDTRLDAAASEMPADTRTDDGDADHLDPHLVSSLSLGS